VNTAPRALETCKERYHAYSAAHSAVPPHRAAVWRLRRISSCKPMNLCRAQRKHAARASDQTLTMNLICVECESVSTADDAEASPGTKAGLVYVTCKHTKRHWTAGPSLKFAVKANS
jgi:hypothetical protein